MPVPNFDVLSAGICAIAGVDSPRLTPDAQGTLAFSLQLQGVVISALELEIDRGHRALFIAEMGPVPLPDALHCWTLLLQANAFLAGACGPYFCRHPRSGQALFAWSCRYADSEVDEAAQQVLRAVPFIKRWRDDPRGLHASAPTSAEAVAPGAVEASSAFGALYQKICDYLPEPPVAFPAEGGVQAFVLRDGGTQVTVRHAPLLRPDAAIVTLHLGLAWDVQNIDVVTSLMEANFALVARPHGGVFSLGPGDIGAQLQYPLPLAGASAQGLLAEIEQLSSVIGALARVAFPRDGARDHPAAAATAVTHWRG